MREYKKYEFCKAFKCPALKDNLCRTDPEVCVFSAKEFHHWLKENGFKIVAAHSDAPTFKIKPSPEMSVDDKYIKFNNLSSNNVLN